jgi:hypothetical protein
VIKEKIRNNKEGWSGRQQEGKKRARREEKKEA